MFKNYIIIAYRSLLKHRMFSFINIVGLAMGITCCLLLFLYVQDEFSYEKHFQDYTNIYRISSTFTREDGTEEKIPRTSMPVALTLLHDLPEVESATRVINPPEVEQHLIQYEDKTFYEKKGYLVDSTFFDVFSYALEEGDVNTALRSPSSVVLSSTVAHTIFGSASALDKLIIITSGGSIDTFRITGVLKPYTHKSQINADFYMCMDSKGWGEYINSITTWVSQNFAFSFIKVKPNVNVATLESKFPALVDTYAANDLHESGMRKSIHLQALTKMHLYSKAAFTSSFGFDDLGTSGDIMYVIVLSSICVFILLIACINFMNLTTAKAAQRAGEVGVRKSMGANRTDLVKQFLGESMTLVTLAMIVSIGMAQLFLPLFNFFSEKELAIHAGNMGGIAAALIGITLITGFIAGIYPAFFLSSFQPAVVLKDKRSSGRTGANVLRKSLVVFQFVITIALISSIIVIYKQMNFIENKTLGFNPAFKITIPLRTAEQKITMTY